MSKLNLVLAIMLFLTLVAGFCFPIKSTSILEWQIQIVNESGEPLPNKEVQQTWYHYGDWENQEIRTSDENGIVVFPQRDYYSPVFFPYFERFF